MHKSIYNKNKNIPYVYFLEWTDLNKKYIGCRYAKNCNPSDLFVSYFTSSKHVKDLLEQGYYPDIINILSTHDSSYDALEEESRLLIESDAISDLSYLNRSLNLSNAGDLVSMNTAREKTMMNIYGVRNAMLNEELKTKQINTIKKLYGVDNISKLNSIKHDKIKTTRKNYGVDHPMQSEQVMQKSRKTSLLKYGVDHPTKTKEVQNKKIQTNIEKYGVAHVRQSKEIQEMAKETSILKYGVDHYFKTDEYKEKMKKLEKKCPFGCISTGGKEYYNTGNYIIHMRSKHKEWYEENLKNAKK